MVAAEETTTLRERFESARSLTDRLFGEVHEDAWFERPIPERHRILFYFGHLEAFDWRQIARSGLGKSPFDETLDTLFAFGIDPPSGELPKDTPSDWPSLEATRLYVRKLRGELDGLIGSVPQDILSLVVEHRLMHAETFSYMLHNISFEKRELGRQTGLASGPSPELRMVEVPGGTVTLGRPSGDGFSWDNEHEETRREVAGFGMSRHKITNGQYRKFVEEGGIVPHYWVLRDGTWHYRGYSAIVPLPEDWPVYVSERQASAFASWCGKRLPSEAEFHRAAFGTLEGPEREFPWGSAPPDSSRGNFGFSSGDLAPVTANPLGDSAFGLSQLVGNGWEWTSTPFAPFPGFSPQPTYPGYSAPFFDDVHYVVKGASCNTAACFLRRSFRNWFRRDYVYVYGTFRIVEA